MLGVPVRQLLLVVDLELFHRRGEIGFTRLKDGGVLFFKLLQRLCGLFLSAGEESGTLDLVSLDRLRVLVLLASERSRHLLGLGCEGGIVIGFAKRECTVVLSGERAKRVGMFALLLLDEGVALLGGALEDVGVLLLQL